MAYVTPIIRRVSERSLHMAYSLGRSRSDWREFLAKIDDHDDIPGIMADIVGDMIPMGYVDEKIAGITMIDGKIQCVRITCESYEPITVEDLAQAMVADNALFKSVFEFEHAMRELDLDNAKVVLDEYDD